MKAMKFFAAAAVVACAAYLFSITARAKPEPKGEKETKTTKLKKNKYAKQMIAHRDKLSDKQLRQFRVTRISVKQMRSIVDRAEKMGAPYIALLPGAYDMTAAQYFAIYNEDGTTNTNKTTITEAADQLEDQTTVIVAIEGPAGEIDVPETYVKSCPPPESCDRDSVQARIASAGY